MNEFDVIVKYMQKNNQINSESIGYMFIQKIGKLGDEICSVLENSYVILRKPCCLYCGTKRDAFHYIHAFRPYSTYHSHSPIHSLTHLHHPFENITGGGGFQRNIQILTFDSVRVLDFANLLRGEGVPRFRQILIIKQLKQLK